MIMLVRKEIIMLRFRLRFFLKLLRRDFSMIFGGLGMGVRVGVMMMNLGMGIFRPLMGNMILGCIRRLADINVHKENSSTQSANKKNTNSTTSTKPPHPPNTPQPSSQTSKSISPYPQNSSKAYTTTLIHPKLVK